MPQQRVNQDRKNRCARMVDHRNSENVVSMELHRLEGRTRTSELDRMVENARRASDFLTARARKPADNPLHPCRGREIGE
jgi:hypothetical protein